MNLQTQDTLNIDEVTNLIYHYGQKRTVLVGGEMGIGKSTILAMLAKMLPNHKPIYFDCTTIDLGDLALPKISGDADAQYSEFVPNKDLGFHLDQPIILMLDEFGKGNNGVKPALTRVILERAMQEMSYHPDSIVFATTNLEEEDVGDFLEAHQWNRMCYVPMRKPNADIWCPWAMLNDVEPVVISTIREFPQMLQPFSEVARYEDNPYINHPDAVRKHFVTPRSLVAASDLIKLRDVLPPQTIRVGLNGVIGAAATNDMLAYIQLADQLPTLESIRTEPALAQVPSTGSAVCMVVYKALQTIDRSWADAWMTYMDRLPKEAQALFAQGVTHKDHPQRNYFVTKQTFTEWCHNNNYLYS